MWNFPAFWTLAFLTRWRFETPCLGSESQVM